MFDNGNIESDIFKIMSSASKSLEHSVYYKLPLKLIFIMSILHPSQNFHLLKDD